MLNEPLNKDDVKNKGAKMDENSLPPDVQNDIEMMSRSREESGINDYESEKALRTGRAVKYQRMYPNSFHRGI